MSAALSFDASVGLLSDASASTTSSRRGRLGTPAPLASKASSISSAAEANDDSPFRFMELLKQIYALFAALDGCDAFKVKYALLQVVRVVTQLSFLVGLWVLSPSLKPSLDANDNAVARSLQKTLDKLAENATTICITHHLGDLKTSDDVIYLDAGHIVEQGSFEELMAAKGTFYDQVNARGDE